MTRIVLKDCVGQLKAAVTTHHDETTFIRDLVTEDLKPGGAFGKFGVPGDTITVEDMNFALPGADKLERLSIASYLPYENEPDFVTVSLYRITAEAVLDDLDEIERTEAHASLEDYILDILHLTSEDEYSVRPGGVYVYYEVERAGRDLIVVKEIKSLNI